MNDENLVRFAAGLFTSFSPVVLTQPGCSWASFDLGQQAPLRRLLAYVLIRKAEKPSRCAMQTSSHVRVSIPADARKLQGELIVPRGAGGVVVFAHGSGSSRHSPRNQFVARELQHAGLATLLLDLLEEEEAEDRSKVFDIGLLALRLLAAARWLGDNPDTRSLALGYFGASTGAAAALLAAAQDPGRVSAVVSRGGRPDLAMRSLPQVKAPTLLIVGEDDEPVLQWNRDAYARLSVEKELVVVPRATHLFEEPGALEEVARHACRWFVRHLSPAGVLAGVGEKARR